MKLIRCKYCNDVVRLVKQEWRKCICKASGGQYLQDDQRAVVGGCCEVIGIRNDYFEHAPFSAEREQEGRGIIIQGEYAGDAEIIRVKSARKPRHNPNLLDA